MAESFLHGVEVVELTQGVRPITATASAVIGLVGTAPYADAAAFPLDTPVLISSATQAKDLTKTLPPEAVSGAEGSLPLAVQAIFDQAKTPIVIVRVDDDADATAQQALVVGDEASRQGVYALLSAQAEVGVTPKILIATGFTHQVPAGGGVNAVAAALKAVAPKLRAIVVDDGPNDTDAAAITKAGLEGSDRVFLVDPHVKVVDFTGATVVRPSSAHVAGLIARVDNDKGFWWSPSNQEILGIVGLGRPIDFALSDSSAGSNLLNAAGVATIVAPGQGGYRLWGNRTAAVDAQWAFLSVRRTADMIYEAIEKSFLWAMDRPMSGQLLGDIKNSVEAYLRTLKARGAILGGKVWLDPELNNAAALQAGRLYINFDFEPPAPLERLTFQAQRESGYYTELVDAAARQTA